MESIRSNRGCGAVRRGGFRCHGNLGFCGLVKKIQRQARVMEGNMKELKEFDYFKAWLLFFLVGTIGGGIVALVISSFVAAFLGAGRMPDTQMNRVLQIIGLVIGIMISYVTFRAVIGKYLVPKLWDDENTRSSDHDLD
jgi:hypothetical protein